MLFFVYMKADLKNRLQELGLYDKEVAIYLAVLERGKISAADLSRLTGIHRTTIYSAIQNLTRLGFIVEELGDSKRHYLPASPESLANIYKIEQEALEQKKVIIETIMKEARELQNSAVYSPPKIRFVQEEQVETFLYEQTPIWIESIMNTDRAWWGFQDHRFAQLFEAWIDWFWEQTPQNLDLKLLSNESEIEEEMKKKGLSRRVIKYWDGNDFTATVWVVGEYIVTLALKDNPFHIVQIHDPLLAENLRNMFSNLWSKSGSAP